MKKTILLTFILFSLCFETNAYYSVYSYDPSYTPYNLQAAIDHGNCDDEIDVFDITYQEIRERWQDYIDGTWASQHSGGIRSAYEAAERAELDAIDRAFITNDLESENAIAECLSSTPTVAEERAKEEREAAEEEKREEEIRLGLASCDLKVMEDMSHAERREYARFYDPCFDKREDVIEAAVAICDFDFFENEMSQEERNDWFAERKECEESLPEVVTVSVPAGEPVVAPEPVIMEPVVTQYVPPSTPAEVIEVAEPEPAQAEEHTPTTTEEKIEVTQEELDRMVEEKMNERLNDSQSEPEPESEQTPEPSFFKKVVNFFFGWMF